METLVPEWEELYLNLGNGSILNHPSFIAVTKHVYRCDPCHFILNGQTEAFGVPCYKVKTPMSGRKITSSPFNFYPPLVGVGNEELAVLALINLTKKNGPDWYLEYKTFTELDCTFVKEIDLRQVESSVVSYLNLADSYNEQIQRYGKSLRQNLRTTYRRAKEKSIYIQWADQISDLKDWYELLVRLYRDKHNMITQPLELFLLLYKKGLGKLLVTRKSGVVIGGIFILCSPQRWDYSWAAYDSSYGKIGLNTMLVDEAIKRAIGNKIKVFDFGSSSPDDEKLIYFKSRWGCESHKVKYYYWNHIPKPLDLESSFILARRAYSWLPIFVLKKLPTLIVPLLA